MAFGKKVKELRLAQKLTKEDFCGDESELSVRQLTRIESGQSVPTLAKVEYIAHRLGVKIGELTGESFELPARYKELKYLLLRTQTYMDPNRIDIYQSYFEQIYNQFYDDLPEEEQLVVDTLESRMGLLVNQEKFVAKKIITDYLNQIKLKEHYSLNDLILIRLYFSLITNENEESSIYDESVYNKILDNLLKHAATFSIDDRFYLNNTLLSALTTAIYLNIAIDTDKVFDTVENIMQETQDFQRMASLNVLKWKFVIKTDKKKAETYYQQACLFAKMTNDKFLEQKLSEEWKKDTAHQ